MFGLSIWGLCICMEVRQAKIAQVAHTLSMGRHRRAAALEKLEVVRAACGKGSRKDTFGVGIDHELGFLRVAFLLATVMPTLFFLGRSMGCSVASTKTTSMAKAKSLDRNT